MRIKSRGALSVTPRAMKHPSKSTSNVKFEKESVEIVKCSLSSAPVLYRIPCGEHKVHVQGG